jgi:N-acyl-phosphatidylethanolamine-hydrolysing phospholipase D
MSALPPHHGPDGRFRNPWPGTIEGRKSFRELLRWQRERRRNPALPTPPPSAFPAARPQIASSLPAGEHARITWVGHSSFLIQLRGHNILTDPVWSERVSPFRGIGPRRITPPGVAMEMLPPIDVVLLSHDHSDHLDEPTVRRVAKRYGSAVTWVTPLRYVEWLAKRGIRNVIELDWWQEATIGTGADALHIRALPAQHWTQRSWRDAFLRLWCSFALTAADGTRIYFGGDSGYGPVYSEIAERESPFDALLLPIGAYDPRWFMAPAHMNPEDAVQAYRDLGAAGAFIPMHWGSFRLADDPPLEPPARLRTAWSAAALPGERLRVLRHGETVSL